MSAEPDWQWREFTIVGRVYSPNKDVAAHRVYWAIRNSESDQEILIDQLSVQDGETK